VVRVEASLVERLRKVVCEQLDVKSEEVSEDASFIDDLGADSLDVVQLAMTIEESFSLEIPDSDYQHFRTVGHALRYLEQRLASQ
jgi:acyl carrier protein